MPPVQLLRFDGAWPRSEGTVVSKQTPSIRQPVQSPAMETAPERQALPGSATDTPLTSGHHPAFGAMRGLLTVAPDLDLTLPAAPEWGQP